MEATLYILGSERCFSHKLCMWMSNWKCSPLSLALFSKKGTWRTELSSENQPTSWSSTPLDPTRQSTAARWPPSTIKGTLMRYLLVLRWEVWSAQLHQAQGRVGRIYIRLPLGKGKIMTRYRNQNLKVTHPALSWRLYQVETGCSSTLLSTPHIFPTSPVNQGFMGRV